VTSNSYDPGTMNPSSIYYWKIVARDSHQAETAGIIWQFTTGNSSDPTPTPTPYTEPCVNYGVKLDMGLHTFCEGNTCYLIAKTCNPGSPRFLPLFVILDVEGSYWFAPSWSQQVDYYLEIINTGWNEKSIISAFTWPHIDGAYDGAVFWGAMTNTEMSELMGDYDMFNFGWDSCK
jgi:hypothetical protein